MFEVQERVTSEEVGERKWDLGFTAGNGETAACVAMMFARTLDAGPTIEGGAEEEEAGQSANPLRGGVLKHLQVLFLVSPLS